jgi:choice-of-anchor C domain-containing protein
MKLNINLAALLFIGASAFSVSLPNSVKAVSISNGSFENGAPIPGDFSTLPSPDATSITDWTVSAGSVDYISTLWSASEGSRSIDLNGSDLGALSTLLTIDSGDVGFEQTILFDLATNGSGQKDLSVSLSGFATLPYSIISTGNKPGDSGNLWTTFSYKFTPTSIGTPTLTFTSLSPGNAGAALDNVRVQPIPFEFSPLSLIGVGAVLFIRSKLLQRRKPYNN